MPTPSAAAKRAQISLLAQFAGGDEDAVGADARIRRSAFGRLDHVGGNQGADAIDFRAAAGLAIRPAGKLTPVFADSAVQGSIDGLSVGRHYRPASDRWPLRLELQQPYPRPQILFGGMLLKIQPGGESEL